MPPKQTQVTCSTARILPSEDSPTRMARAPLVTVLFLFGDSPSMHFQREKHTSAVFPFKRSLSMSLHLVRFTDKNCNLYPIGLMRVYMQLM